MSIYREGSVINIVNEGVINERTVGGERFHILLAGITGKLKTEDLNKQDIETRLNAAKKCKENAEKLLKDYTNAETKDEQRTLRRMSSEYRKYFWWGAAMIIGLPINLIFSLLITHFRFGLNAEAKMKIIIKDNEKAIRYLNQRLKDHNYRVGKAKNESTIFDDIELI